MLEKKHKPIAKSYATLGAELPNSYSLYLRDIVDSSEPLEAHEEEKLTIEIETYRRIWALLASENPYEALQTQLINSTNSDIERKILDLLVEKINELDFHQDQSVYLDQLFTAQDEINARLAQLEEQLIQANYRLVIDYCFKAAIKFRLDVMDLIQEGNLALIRGVRKYSPCIKANRGDNVGGRVRVSTYLTPRIKSAVNRAGLKLRSIDRSVPMHQKFNRITKAMQKLGIYTSIASDITYADLAELARELRISEKKLTKYLSLMAQMIPVDFNARKTDNGEGDALAGDNFIVDGNNSGSVTRTTENKALATGHQDILLRLRDTLLTGEEKRILRLKYHEGLTLEEIGKILGITPERVRQLHYKITARLLVAASLEDAIGANFIESQKARVLTLRFIEGKGKDAAASIMGLHKAQLAKIERDGLNTLRRFTAN